MLVYFKKNFHFLNNVFFSKKLTSYYINTNSSLFFMVRRAAAKKGLERTSKRLSSSSSSTNAHSKSFTSKKFISKRGVSKQFVSKRGIKHGSAIKSPSGLKPNVDNRLVGGINQKVNEKPALKKRGLKHTPPTSDSRRSRAKKVRLLNEGINFTREGKKGNARKTPTDVVCVLCKKKFTLPFKPRNPKVYCDACFKKIKR